LDCRKVPDFFYSLVNQQQNALNLQAVLDPAELSTHEGLARSNETLAQLETLMAASEQAHGQFMTAFTNEIGLLLAQAPQSVASELSSEFIPTLQQQLNTQVDFYYQRKRWVTAARDLLEFLSHRLDSVCFTPEGMVFQSDEEADRWEALIGVIDAVHEKEVALRHVRVTQIRASAALLGLPFEQ